MAIVEVVDLMCVDIFGSLEGHVFQAGIDAGEGSDQCHPVNVDAARQTRLVPECFVMLGLP